MDSLLEPEDALFAQRALAAPWGQVGRSWTLGLVSLLSKLWLTVLNDFRVEEGLDAFYQHTMAREEGRGLITVCNHTRRGRRGAGGAGACAPAAAAAFAKSCSPPCCRCCSTADDPAVFCAMLPASFFFTEHRHLSNRWSLCAKVWVGGRCAGQPARGSIPRCATAGRRGWRAGRFLPWLTSLVGVAASAAAAPP